MLVGACLAWPAVAADDYSDAYLKARDSGKLLVVTVGVDGPLLADTAQFVVCRLPSGAIHDATGKRFAVQPSLALMDGDGAFVVRFPPYRTHEPGAVISVLPKRHCSADGLRAFVHLPAFTITQNALIWAVRTHPECPHSADGYQDFQLANRATLVSETQADNGRSGHPVPWPADVCEVTTESWPRNTNVVDAAVDLVATWRQSAGHWAAVRAPNRGYGYDMRFGLNRRIGQGTWFGTGCFRK